MKSRPDADPRGVGFYGISKGGGAGLLAYANDPYVRCFVTDGIFATFTTVVPYMRKWIGIYNKHLQDPGAAAVVVLRDRGPDCVGRLARKQGFRLPDLEKVMARLAPRPLLMIHGGGDTYIKPPMAEALYRLAREPKELWMVDGAKHNQALHIAGDEYRRRTLEFFCKHLASPAPDRNGNAEKKAESPAAPAPAGALQRSFPGSAWERTSARLRLAERR